MTAQTTEMDMVLRKWRTAEKLVPDILNGIKESTLAHKHPIAEDLLYGATCGDTWDDSLYRLRNEAENELERIFGYKDAKRLIRAYQHVLAQDAIQAIGTNTLEVDQTGLANLLDNYLLAQHDDFAAAEELDFLTRAVRFRFGTRAQEVTRAYEQKYPYVAEK